MAQGGLRHSQLYAARHSSHNGSIAVSTICRQSVVSILSFLSWRSYSALIDK
jgi:hypothetical protein